MRASVINQYPRQDSTAERIGALLTDFSAQESAQFRALTAFASEAGLRMLEPGLRRFLDSGHSIFWIVGVDLGGTGREALEFLYDLKREYAGRVDARVFSTGDNRTIFHPKVYWLDAGDRKVVVVGSANATAGGLTHNFEASVQLELEPVTDEEVLEELDFLWISYSSPLPPLLTENLLEIDRSLIALLNHDHSRANGRARQPHPLRGLVRSPPRRPAAPSPRGRRRRHARAGRELLMDILQETRQTQVQLPVEVLPSFFVGADDVRLRQIRRGVIVKSDVRPIIHLGNNTHRVEIDAIRGLPRPQIIRFHRPGRSAAVIDYEVVLKGTREYRELDQLLSERGQQTRRGARRWLLK
jgi:HKD family nuclease